MPLQRPATSKQDYGTPDDFLSAVKARLGIEQFDMDLAATAENTVVPDWFYDEECDSLSMPWQIGLGGWNWLNPEYKNIGPWVAKALMEARENGVRTAVLVPASCGANWFRDYVHLKAHVLMLNGRLQFKGAEGLYPKDCVLLLYGPDVPIGYDVWTWKSEVPSV